MMVIEAPSVAIGREFCRVPPDPARLHGVDGGEVTGQQRWR